LDAPTRATSDQGKKKKKKRGGEGKEAHHKSCFKTGHYFGAEQGRHKGKKKEGEKREGKKKRRFSLLLTFAALLQE